MSIWNRHKIFEKNPIVLILGIVVVIAIGGLVEIAPLFYLRSTIERVEGVRPYSPLEFAGREIYVREGCYNCHSQMVRPLRDEVERYGHYSLAAESMFDKPFQWGSKRTGPDLARVGGKYSDEWHVAHMIDPRSIVPQSIMPGYRFLATATVNPDRIAERMATARTAGVPYTNEQLEHAVADLRAQANPDSNDLQGLRARYTRVQIRNFGGGTPGAPVSEMDALVAYLQVLGTMVDFRTYDARANIR